MNKKTFLFPFLILLFVSVLACNNEAQEKDEFNITAENLKELMASDTNLVILDVRTPQELVGQHGQIDGVINIPVQVLNNRVNELESYKDKNFAVICRSGNRSVFGTKILLQNGYKAKNVLGGMKAYNRIK